MTSEATIYREHSYDILPVYPCCTIGARLLHYRCKAAALTVLGCFIVTIRQKKNNLLNKKNNLLNINKAVTFRLCN